ncbi:MAG: hypothetical protein ABJL55_23460 [Roseibium sp.]
MELIVGFVGDGFTTCFADLLVSLEPREVSLTCSETLAVWPVVRVTPVEISAVASACCWTEVAMTVAATSKGLLPVLGMLCLM